MGGGIIAQAQHRQMAVTGRQTACGDLGMARAGLSPRSPRLPRTSGHRLRTLRLSRSIASLSDSWRAQETRRQNWIHVCWRQRAAAGHREPSSACHSPSAQGFGCSMAWMACIPSWPCDKFVPPRRVRSHDTSYPSALECQHHARLLRHDIWRGRSSGNGASRE
jgi:hypothetical protein